MDAVQTEPFVRLTQNAIDQVRIVQEADPTAAGKCLRIYAEPDTCETQFGMHFDFERPEDFRTEHDGLVVIVDPISLERLRGVVIDFVDTLNGGGFHVAQR